MPGDQAGTSVANAGDVNGDHVPDQLIGAAESSPGGRTGAGSVFVVFGQPNGTSISLAAVGVVPSAGCRFDGEAPNDGLGTAVAATRGVFKGRAPAFVMGAPFTSPKGRTDAGTVYVVRGCGGLPTTDLGSTGWRGFSVLGKTVQGGLGSAVAVGRGVRGRGEVDLLLSSPGLLMVTVDDGGTAQSRSMDFSATEGAASEPPGDSGEGFVISRRPSSEVIDLARSRPRLLRIVGGRLGEQLAGSMTTIPDLNGDGRREVVVGASGSQARGDAFIVHGRGRGRVNIRRAFDGFILHGRAAAGFGHGVIATDDVDGDALRELLVTSPFATIDGVPKAGQAKLFYSKALRRAD